MQCEQKAYWYQFCYLLFCCFYYFVIVIFVINFAQNRYVRLFVWLLFSIKIPKTRFFPRSFFCSLQCLFKPVFIPVVFVQAQCFPNHGVKRIGKNIIHSATRVVFNRASKVILRLLLVCIATLSDWSKYLAPLSQPITK